MLIVAGHSSTVGGDLKNTRTNSNKILFISRTDLANDISCSRKVVFAFFLSREETLFELPVGREVPVRIADNKQLRLLAWLNLKEFLT